MSVWPSAAAAVGEATGWLLAGPGAGLVEVCAASDAGGFDCAWPASEPIVPASGAVDCPFAGEAGVDGSGSPAANMSGVGATGAPDGVALEPIAGVPLAALWSVGAVSPVVGAAGAATGTSAARAAAAAAAAAAEGSLTFVWPVCDEGFEDLPPLFAPEFEFESAAPEAVWPLSLVAPLVVWPCDPEFVEAPAAVVEPEGGEPAPWVVALEFDDSEDEEFPGEAFDEFDGALPCAEAGGLTGGEAVPDEPFAGDEPMFVCRMSEKFCDGAFAGAELVAAGGAELGAVIISRIASVMNLAARA